MLYIPLIVNSRTIGEVKIWRRDDQTPSADGDYIYDWDAVMYGQDLVSGLRYTHKSWSGEVTHRFSEGAFALTRKVMEAIK